LTNNPDPSLRQQQKLANQSFNPIRKKGERGGVGGGVMYSGGCDGIGQGAKKKKKRRPERGGKEKKRKERAREEKQ
jgi:hypothetical protein